MSRIDIRTPDAWRSYDFWSGMIALAIPLTLAGLWFAGVTPPLSSCCGGLSPAAVKAPAVAGSVPAALVASEVTFASDGGKVTLKGKIGDDRIREELIAQARRAFGTDNVVDRLEVVPGRAPLAWIGFAKQIFADFHDMPAPASIVTGNSLVTLTGAVESEGEKDVRGARARQLFGDGVTIANGIVVHPPKVALAPVVVPVAVPKIDCTTLTKGAQIEFPTGSAELTESGKSVLDGLAPCIVDGSWELGGHTDDTGSAETNEQLSLKRALAAVEYLKQSKGGGISLKAKGYGSSEPAFDNDSDENRAKNRRLTFKRAVN